MSELIIESEEIEEPKTRSIVPIDAALHAGHEVFEVEYNGIKGSLMRYRDEDQELLALTMTEFNECLALNRSDEDALN